MSTFRCDFKKKNGEDCKFEPYAEVFPYEVDENNKPVMMEDCNCPKFNDKGWSYLCRWHFYLAKLRGDKFAWCKVDTDRETLEHIREELWDIESDLWDIKEKLGIKDTITLLTPLEELWNNPKDEIWNDYPLTEEDWNKRIKEIKKDKKENQRYKDYEDFNDYYEDLPLNEEEKKSRIDHGKCKTNPNDPGPYTKEIIKEKKRKKK